jgi:hypothetical protein
MSLTTYLLVRDADGAILGEFDSAASVAAVLEQSDELGPGVSVVRCYDSRARRDRRYHRAREGSTRRLSVRRRSAAVT